MSEPPDSYTRHAAHFERVYDLDDPSPYFNTIGPSGYCMPATLAGALKAMHGPLCAVRGAGETPRVLDFACGYGAIGALLRHDALHGGALCPLRGAAVAAGRRAALLG